MNNTVCAGVLALPAFYRRKPALPWLKRFPISTPTGIRTRHTREEGVKARCKEHTILVIVVGWHVPCPSPRVAFRLV